MARIVYRPTRTGVFLKDPNDPTKSAAITLRHQDIVVHWNDGFTPRSIERAAREWYPAARGSVLFER